MIITINKRLRLNIYEENMSKKILILTASTGGGHNSAARAIASELETQGAKPIILDALKDLGYIGKFFDVIISQGYETSAKYTPKIYGRAYDVADLKLVRKSFDLNLVVTYMEKNILKILEQEQLDEVITTHPFAAIAVSNIKKKYLSQLSITCIITDYTPHKSYISKYINRYIVAHEDTSMLMQNEGIDKNKIYPYGLPIQVKNEPSVEKSVLKSAYNLNDNFTVLIMGGSFGAGKITKTLKQIENLDVSINIIVICGRNESLKEALDEKLNNNPPLNKTLVIGFTDRMNDFYKIADVAITKPGGLTLTECLYYEVPMIVPYYIPGQEEGNKDFILNNQLGEAPSKYYPLPVLVKSLMYDEHKMEIIKKSLRKNKKTDSAKHIAQLVLSN